jgi:hypothetical protein
MKCTHDGKIREQAIENLTPLYDNRLSVCRGLRENIRGPFGKFVDSPYYSDSELCGGAVTVSFSKYLPWQAMHFLQRSIHLSKTCCRLYGGCSNGVPPIHFFQAEHRIQFRSRLTRFLCFPNHKKGAPRQESYKWSTVCSTFSRSGWSVVRSAKGGTLKKRPSPHLHKVPTRE